VSVRPNLGKPANYLCPAQIDLCSALCAGNPAANTCTSDNEAVAGGVDNPFKVITYCFECACADGTVPDLEEYWYSIPTAICQLKRQDCVYWSFGQGIEHCPVCGEKETPPLDGGDKSSTGGVPPPSSSTAGGGSSSSSSASASTSSSGWVGSVTATSTGATSSGGVVSSTSASGSGSGGPVPSQTGSSSSGGIGGPSSFSSSVLSSSVGGPGSSSSSSGAVITSSSSYYVQPSANATASATSSIVTAGAAGQPAMGVLGVGLAALAAVVL